ncbi:hypothetical protein BRY75_09670 [Acinetobacter baumannii]|uniref:hypothetical protein n=1 Tax=Acinetobacter baumannii TaxID=470 RepID=UPI00092BF2A6|nr:hypothetical protein [Acinetobacter baumannii]OJK06998.1 hypothetical protein BRY75_09670 [Acinetobacter baumannii]
MKRKFIAYDPDSCTLLRLKEYSYISKSGIRKNYLMDKNKNIVFNPDLNKAFETEEYTNNMLIEISKKRYYLISEF